MSVSPEAVLEFLKSHPEFFEEQAEFFHQVEIAHPYSGRTISLAERQMITLREKNRLLEHRLGELLGVGESNDALGARMHQLTVALVGAGRLDQIVGTVLKSKMDPAKDGDELVKLLDLEQASRQTGDGWGILRANLEILRLKILLEPTGDGPRRGGAVRRRAAALRHRRGGGAEGGRV
ncbi:MAG: DUF484 family protein, partial [Burkholderiales bacterium]